MPDYKLVEISYDEYCTLFDAGAWVQTDSHDTRQWKDGSCMHSHPLLRNRDGMLFGGYDGWYYYTRIGEQDDELQ